MEKLPQLVGLDRGESVYTWARSNVARRLAPRCPVCDRKASDGVELGDSMVAPVNRLNVGNPNYTPHKVPAKEESAASDRTTTLPRPLTIMPSKAHLLIRRLVV